MGSDIYEAAVMQSVMTSQQIWHNELTFTDRLAAASKITEGIGRSDPNLTPQERQQKARDLERSFYHGFNTRAAYEAACRSMNQSQDGDESEVKDGRHEIPGDGITIGKYESAKHYKDGLFSTIYKAPSEKDAISRVKSSNSLADMVALKVTTPSMMTAPHNSEREASILKFSSHKRVISLLETFRLAGGRFVLVFPFMPYDLEYLLKNRRLNADQAKSTLFNLFEALAFLHSKNIIHRDVKPSNILLKSPSGPAYLADFGIAWSPTDTAGESPHSKITDVGTTSYRPPELLFGNSRYGCELDLWAAGCVVAEVSSLRSQTLFDSGDLGSELALIRSMFQNLGTPTLKEWPEVETYPDWGKMEFRQYPARPWSEVLPHAAEAARDLTSKLVRYESGQRVTAEEASTASVGAEGIY